MMSKRKSTEEGRLADVLSYQAKSTDDLTRGISELSDSFCEYESLLLSRGIQVDDSNVITLSDEHVLDQIPSWEDCIAVARDKVGKGNNLDDLFTDEERSAIDRLLSGLQEDYNSLYRLDAIDVAISVSAGLLSAAVNILLVGVPMRTSDGLRGNLLENYVRDWFLDRFPAEEMECLARDISSKVPYDAPYNTNFTETYVEGLWPAMHRLYSLGHDPVLGFVVGTLDILTGKMTTIDKLGQIATQEIPRYADRKAASLFAALCKQIIHLKSDITTSMSLPAPLMGLFNLIQFGSVGEENQTIAEIVQGMYYEGYDFQHFCAQSIPVMLAEAVVRLGYFLRRIKEGAPIKQALPVATNREKCPKLGTMLFTAHSLAAAVNAGKVAFTKNPMEISYPQWIAFAAYSIKQACWVLATKPKKQHAYIMNSLEAEITRIGSTESGETLLLGI